MTLNDRLAELYRIELFNTIVRGKLKEGLLHEEAKKFAFALLDELEASVEGDFIEEEGRRGQKRRANAVASVNIRREALVSA